MCCFIVPMVQAIATTAYRKHSQNKQSNSVWKSHIPTLEKFLWGGTAMLLVDHAISGEITWQFPFFTALGQTGGAEVMLHEMLTVGIPMSVVVTLMWVVYVLVKSPVLRRQTR